MVIIIGSPILFIACIALLVPYVIAGVRVLSRRAHIPHNHGLRRIK